MAMIVCACVVVSPRTASFRRVNTVNPFPKVHGTHRKQFWCRLIQNLLLANSKSHCSPPVRVVNMRGVVSSHGQK